MLIPEIAQLLNEFKCIGPCAHGQCIDEKECKECGLYDIDSWCLTCRIWLVIRNNGISDV